MERRVVAALSLAAAACGLFLLVRPLPAQVVSKGGVTTVISGRDWRLPHPGRGELLVGRFGTLVRLEGGCLALVSPRDSPSHAVKTAHAIVWPRGTTIEDEGTDVVIRTPNRTVRVGDHLVGGPGDAWAPLNGVRGKLTPECRHLPLEPFAFGD